MKKFKFNKNKKSFILSLLLLAAVVGTAGTVALAVGKSNKVINTFQAADNNTGIDEGDGGEPKNKVVSIKNESEKDKAFIRARVTVSPEGACKVDTSRAESWEYCKEDGFYYYLKAVAPKGKTTELFNGVTPSDDFKGDTFDVTVYEESCVANVSSDKDLDINIVKAAFDKAEKSGTVEVK